MRLGYTLLLVALPVALCRPLGSEATSPSLDLEIRQPQLSDRTLTGRSDSGGGYAATLTALTTMESTLIKDGLDPLLYAEGLVSILQEVNSLLTNLKTNPPSVISFISILSAINDILKTLKSGLSIETIGSVSENNLGTISVVADNLLGTLNVFLTSFVAAFGNVDSVSALGDNAIGSVNDLIKTIRG